MPRLRNTLLPAVLLTAALALPAAAADAAASAPVDSAALADPLRIGAVRGDTLYVDQAKVIAAALERNEMLAASGAMRDAASADALGAWRGFLPQVQLGEFFLRSDDALMSFGYKLQRRSVTQMDFIPDDLNNHGETNHFVTRLQLLQPVFNGGMSWSGKSAADAMSRAADFNHARAGETVRFHAVQACEGLALAQAYEQVMTTAVASAEGHVRQAQSMVDNEMATAADLLQAKVYLSGLRQKLIEVRSMVAVAGEHVKLLTAVRTDLPLAVTTPLDHVSQGELPPAFDPATAAMRSDIRARHEEAAAAGSMVGVARGAMLPHVNLSLHKDWFSEESLFGNDANSWSLGVYGTWDIFKGLQNVGELKKARAQKRAAEHMAAFETRQAQVQATEAWLKAQAAAEKVTVARDAVEAAREGLRIVGNQYREGLASMVDLLDTQAAATMAEGNLVQALHDYNVGLANLKFSGGAGAPQEN
jgi:outer membrane protein